MRRGLAALALIAACGTASATPVLTVERIAGQAQVDQLGETRRLQLGDELHDRDVVRLADDAYLSLRFGPNSALELGPGAAFAIERLPASLEATDLRSIFSLWKGYLHVVWQRPPSVRWPLYVYFGGQRSGLIDGEYFFERAGERTRACVAAGRLAVTPISGEGLEGLLPSACYELQAGGIVKSHARAAESWVAVRQSFALDPTPGKPLPVFALPEPAAATPEPGEPTTAAPEAAPPASTPPATGTPPPAVPVKPVVPAPVVAKPPATPPATMAGGDKPAAKAPAAKADASATPSAKLPAVSAATLAPSPSLAPRPVPGEIAALPGRSEPAARAAAAGPNAAPKTEAGEKADAASAGGGDPAGWTILVGSYADPQNAEQVQQKLISAGYTPFLRIKNVDGKTWNSVQLRGFGTREAAQKQLDALQARFGLPNLRIVQLP